jgi:hypothetical protein
MSFYKKFSIFNKNKKKHYSLNNKNKSIDNYNNNNNNNNNNLFIQPRSDSLHYNIKKSKETNSLNYKSITYFDYDLQKQRTVYIPKHVSIIQQHNIQTEYDDLYSLSNIDDITTDSKIFSTISSENSQENTFQKYNSCNYDNQFFIHKQLYQDDNSIYSNISFDSIFEEEQNNYKIINEIIDEYN